MSNVKETMKITFAKLNYWRKEYDKGTPVVDDQEYDQEYQILKELERAHPEMTLSNSPTRTRSESLASVEGMVHHEPKMLSLRNTYDIEAFEQVFSKFVGDGTSPIAIQCKVDGVAVSIRYIDGELADASLHGDGEYGEDVTPAVALMPGVPKTTDRLFKLREGGGPKNVNLRGEIYMPRSEFRRINEERVAEGLDPFKTPRNATAGSIRLMDPKEVLDRRLQLFPFDLYELGTRKTIYFHDCIHSREPYSFVIDSPFGARQAISDALVATNSIIQRREELDFDIDGIVAKSLSEDMQEKLGENNKTPNWAVALKFSGETKRRKLKGTGYQVSKVGKITPVAHFNPTTLNGRTCSTAPLHNFNWTFKRNIHIGDILAVTLAGLTIPQVLANLDLNAKDGKVGRERVLPPELCPSCDSPVEISEDYKYVRCTTPSDCDEAVVNYLDSAFTRKTLDIKGLSKTAFNEIFVRLGVRTVGGVLNLSEKDWGSINALTGTKRTFVPRCVQNLRDNPISLSKYLLALSIPHCGPVMCKTLAQRFETLFDVKEALLSGEGIEDLFNEKRMEVLKEYAQEDRFLKEVDYSLRLSLSFIN